jgi:HK97 family phage portal protein
VADRHPLYSVLHDAPNPWMTAFEFREMMQGHVLLRGNAYAYVVRDGSARVVGLKPIHPDCVTPLKALDGEPFYRVADDDLVGTFSRWDIFHLRGHCSDGYVGISPIGLTRDTIGLSVVLLEQGSRLFSNGTVTSGVLEYPHPLKDFNIDQLRAQWQDTYGGSRNAYKPLILEKGMTWKSLGMTSEDAQFLETRAFQDQQIYRIFGVPPHMLGDNEKTTSWGTGVEQLSIGFVQWTLTPWLKRWEQAISQTLLRPDERRVYYPEFEVDGLLRGDQKSRNEALAIKRQNGIINANEWRRLENLDPISGPAGEAYLVNGAMVATTAIAASEPDDAEDEDEDENEDETPTAEER